MSSQLYQLCQACGRMKGLLDSMSIPMCSVCLQNQAGYRSYAPTVIPIKPGERMNKEQKPVEPVKEYKGEWVGQGSGAPGLKDDGGKLMWNLLPWKACEGMVKVLTFGARKYSPNGWRSVPNAKERYIAALLRHLSAMNVGQVSDPDSGLRHIDHVLCNAAFLSELED